MFNVTTEKQNEGQIYANLFTIVIIFIVSQQQTF